MIVTPRVSIYVLPSFGVARLLPASLDRFTNFGPLPFLWLDNTE